MLCVYICTVTKCHEIASCTARERRTPLTNDPLPLPLHTSSHLCICTLQHEWERGAGGAGVLILIYRPYPLPPGATSSHACARDTPSHLSTMSLRGSRPNVRHCLLCRQIDERTCSPSGHRRSRSTVRVCVRVNACACSADFCNSRPEHNHALFHLLSLPGRSCASNTSPNGMETLGTPSTHFSVF